MPAKKAEGVRDASQESWGRQGRLPRKPGTCGGILCMYPAFLCSRKPPAGRVGAYRIRPPTRPGIRGECVFLVFKHRFIVIQTQFKRHSNSSLRAVGEGRQGRQPSWPGTSNAYPDRFAGVRPLPRLGSWPGTSKARTKQTSPASGLCRGWEVGRVPQKPVPSKLRRRPQTPRGVGNDETGCLKIFEGSEMMKQVV